MNILCNNCCHRQICKNKDKYTGLFNSINELVEKNQDLNDFHVNISCKNYLCSYEMIKEI